MGQEQLQRGHLMKMMEVGERTGVSCQQAKRIGRVIREKGMEALFHGNRGRPSNHRIQESL